MVRIRRFGIRKTATMVSALYMIGAAIFAIPFLLIAAMLGASANGSGSSGPGFVALGFGLLVIIFLYGIVVWVTTAIGCALYNLTARWFGGIEVEVERVAPPLPPAGLPAWTTQGPPAR